MFWYNFYHLSCLTTELDWHENTYMQELMDMYYEYGVKTYKCFVCFHEDI